MPDSLDALERALESIVKTPPGWKKLEGEDLRVFHQTSMELEYFRAKKEIQETRVREYQNGLEAARYALKDAERQFEIIAHKIRTIEGRLGIVDQERDLQTIDGEPYIRISQVENK